MTDAEDTHYSDKTGHAARGDAMRVDKQIDRIESKADRRAADDATAAAAEADAAAAERAEQDRIAAEVEAEKAAEANRRERELREWLSNRGDGPSAGR